jgi:transposase
VYQDLKTDQGFGGAYDSVKRYVRRMFGRAVEHISRMECQPGEEAQVDFGLGAPIVEAHGQRRRCWVFRIVLSYSRKAYSEAVFRQTTEAFIRALENAFRYLGGVPKTLILDNLKAAVQYADWYDPELNPKILEFARHYGITILPIRAGTPRHNGKVENSVKYVKNNALKSRSFPSLAAENLFLQNWEKTVADCRIHGTTRQQPCRRFAIERPRLLPLPAGLFPCFQEGKRSVHRDSYVEVGRAYYRVPEEYIGNQVWARWDSHLVRVFNLRLEPVKVFARLAPGQFSEVLGAGGFSPKIEHSVEYWQDRAAKMGAHCELWAHRIVEERGAYGIRVLQGLVALSRTRSSAKIDAACRKALADGRMHLRQIRGLIDASEEQTELSFLSEHPLIRKMDDYGQILAALQEAKHDEERTEQDLEAVATLGTGPESGGALAGGDGQQPHARGVP